MTTYLKDRRKAARIERSFRVEYVINGRRSMAFAVNLSMGGIFLRSASQLSEGTQTDFMLALFPNAEPTTLGGRVLACASNQARVQWVPGHPGLGELQSYFETVVIPELEAATQGPRPDVTRLSVLARLYAEFDRREAALALYRKQRAVSPGDVKLLEQMGLFLLRLAEGEPPHQPDLLPEIDSVVTAGMVLGDTEVLTHIKKTSTGLSEQHRKRSIAARSEGSQDALSQERRNLEEERKRVAQSEAALAAQRRVLEDEKRQVQAQAAQHDKTLRSVEEQKRANEQRAVDLQQREVQMEAAMTDRRRALEAEFAQRQGGGGSAQGGLQEREARLADEQRVLQQHQAALTQAQQALAQEREALQRERTSLEVQAVAAREKAVLAERAAARAAEEAAQERAWEEQRAQRAAAKSEDSARVAEDNAQRLARARAEEDAQRASRARAEDDAARAHADAARASVDQAARAHADAMDDASHTRVEASPPGDAAQQPIGRANPASPPPTGEEPVWGELDDGDLMPVSPAPQPVPTAPEAGHGGPSAASMETMELDLNETSPPPAGALDPEGFDPQADVNTMVVAGASIADINPERSRTQTMEPLAFTGDAPTRPVDARLEHDDFFSNYDASMPQEPSSDPAVAPRKSTLEVLLDRPREQLIVMAGGAAVLLIVLIGLLIHALSKPDAPAEGAPAADTATPATPAAEPAQPPAIPDAPKGARAKNAKHGKAGHAKKKHH